MAETAVLFCPQLDEEKETCYNQHSTHRLEE